MSRSKRWQWVRLSVLAAVFSLTMGSLAWGYDGDDRYYRRDEAREHGFQNGYRDGSTAGRSDSERGRRFKDEVREVPAGQECGMAFANYQDIRAGDVIECFNVETIARSL